MQLLQPFDATQHDPTQSAGQLPVGKHPVQITDSNVKATKNNDGGLLELMLTIINGPQAGTTGVYRLNLYNANQQTCAIAHKQLSAICHAIGVYNVSDTQQLHNKPFIVEVGLQRSPEAQEKGYTEVKKVFDINGNEPGKAPTQNSFGGQQSAPVQEQAPQQQAAPTPWGQQQQAPPNQQPLDQGHQQQTPPPWGVSQPQTGNQSTPPWGQK